MKGKKIIILVITLVVFWATNAQAENWYHFTAGQDALQKKQYEKALNEFDYYLTVNERAFFGLSHFGKANVYMKTGRTGDAITEFQLAIENDFHPRVKVTDKSYLNMGTIYFKKKRYHDAMQAYSRAVESNPTNGLAHYYLGLSYFEAGEYEKAEISSEKAEKLGVPFTALAEKLDKIARDRD